MKTFNVMMVSSLLWGLCMTVNGQQVFPGSDLGKVFKTSTLQRVSVHDPSVVMDTLSDQTTYYIFGSHLGVARTTDMTNWTEVYNQGRCSGMFGKRSANGTVTRLTTFDQAFQNDSTNAAAWSKASGTNTIAGYMWAPDVLYNPAMRKWCMYMSLDGDHWMSVICLLTSDNIGGPYVYEAPVVYSGFHWTGHPSMTYHDTDLEQDIGTQKTLPSRYLPTAWGASSGWGNRWPNNIDPCVFFDDDNRLWMTYGSWSGGIFALRLDPTTGLRDTSVTYTLQGSGDDITQDPYFGKKIAGGHYVSGEASYVQKIGRYYYLFMTYGGLTSDGGYEMRVFRSTKPDGPYTDAKSQSAIFSSYQLNYSKNANSTAGNRLFGAYQWQNMDDAEIAQGHNSAFVDAEGRALLVYHSRFVHGGEGHQVRVHQLFQNKTGWLVAAPYEYMGSRLTQDSVAKRRLCTDADIVGTYQVLLHPYRQDNSEKEYAHMQQVVLHDDGTVTGDYHGTWTVTDGTSYITLSLATESTSLRTVYNGVVVPQQISGTNVQSVCFSAMATTGVTLWGSNADDRAAIDYTYTQIKNDLPRNFQTLTADLVLPTTGYYGAEVTWSSDCPQIMDDQGHLLLTPSTDTTDPRYAVKMTFCVSKDDYIYTGSRTVYVRLNEADGVEGIESENIRPARGCYDLAGRRVEVQRGIIVRDGRKVFVP